MHLEPDDATTWIDRHNADVQRRGRVRAEEKPGRIAAQHVDRRHHRAEVATESGVHPVVDERIEHRVGHGQPVETLKRMTRIMPYCQLSYTLMESL